MIELLNNYYFFFGVLISGNILMYLFNILINYAWSRLNKTKTLKIQKSDLRNSLLILIINILIAIPGYILFKATYIKFTENHFLTDLLLLFIGFDFAMYSLHYLSHTIKPLKKLHEKHHSHNYFNILSLYVMHPFETISFGLLLTFASLIFSLNFYSFLIFLILNWVYGVIAHLNTKSIKQPIILGNHIFHKTHHMQIHYNYGFYTTIWDKIFRTSFKEEKIKQ